ncbi:hypothetical protein T484DRAFT_1833822 [Baffinella frigidus]|nr:hypothetical protein T484DRAFT_1833822 [Cryptophyta sp. CCMP2293]
MAEGGEGARSRPPRASPKTRHVAKPTLSAFEGENAVAPPPHKSPKKRHVLGQVPRSATWAWGPKPTLSAFEIVQVAFESPGDGDDAARENSQAQTPAKRGVPAAAASPHPPKNPFRDAGSAVWREPCEDSSLNESLESAGEQPRDAGAHQLEEERPARKEQDGQGQREVCEALGPEQPLPPREAKAKRRREGVQAAPPKNPFRDANSAVWREPCEDSSLNASLESQEQPRSPPAWVGEQPHEAGACQEEEQHLSSLERSEAFSEHAAAEQDREKGEEAREAVAPQLEEQHAAALQEQDGAGHRDVCAALRPEQSLKRARSPGEPHAGAEPRCSARPEAEESSHAGARPLWQTIAPDATVPRPCVEGGGSGAAAACSQRSCSEAPGTQRERDGEGHRDVCAALRPAQSLERSEAEESSQSVGSLSLRSLPESCGPTQGGWATQVNHSVLEVL